MSSSSVLEVEALGELQITKNSLGSEEMLLARLGDVLESSPMTYARSGLVPIMAYISDTT